MNTLLRFMANEWKVKQSFFLVGNHDMPLLNTSEVNGLEAFALVNKTIKVIERPTVLRDFLLVPYMHLSKALQTVLETYNKYDRIKMAVLHAEVKGAMLHPGMSSANGFDTTALRFSIVSGHLHAPHNIHGGRVTYVGSPWQTSMAESGQRKRFLVFDDDWGRLLDIACDHSRKYYKVRESSGIGLKRKFDQLGSKVEKQGVVVFDGFSEVLDAAKGWAERGVVVKRKPKRRKLSLFREYATMQGVDPKTLQQGLQIARDCGLASFHGSHQAPLHVAFHSIEMQHFGPFKQAAYDYKTGRTVVSAARVTDTEHSAIGWNGTGKSLLTIGAFMFALTGEADPRPTFNGELKGPSAELIHRGTDFCEVTLKGSVNNKSFVVTRWMSRTGKCKHRLNFNVGGVNMTHSVLKQTQKKLGHILFNLTGDESGAPARALQRCLLRTCIWSQNDASHFIDGGAKATKQELLWLVDDHAWQGTRIMHVDYFSLDVEGAELMILELLFTLLRSGTLTVNV